MHPLHTPRLVLEPQVAAHAEAMFAVLSDPAIYGHENAPPASAEALRERYRRLESRRSPDGRQLWLNWTVRLAADGTAIGYVQATVLLPGRDCIIGYEFGSAWWGRGLAQEAAGAMLRELRQRYRVAAVGAVFKRTNERSRRLLARLGLRAALPGQFPATLAGTDELGWVLD